MNDNDIFCGNCGARSDMGQQGNTPPPFTGGTAGESQWNVDKGKSSSSIIDSINDYIGNNQPVDLNWKDLFTDVFKSHSNADAEEIFVCGTARTTPPIDAVSETWPRPWLYSRVFALFAVSCILLIIGFNMWQNINLIPGIIAVGSFAVPLTTMVLFLEVNAYRDISVYTLIKVFLVGGCASLIATLVLYAIFPFADISFGGAVIIGIVEEIGKLVIVYIFLSRLAKCRHILGGLLVGSAVGAGFAAFESAGYAFNQLLMVGDFDQMVDLILLRGFLAPGGHVTWAAISGAALMIARGKGELTVETMLSSRFLKLFIIPVGLHAVWDMPIEFGSDLYLIPILLTVAVWIVVLILINMGLDEVKQRKLRYL